MLAKKVHNKILRHAGRLVEICDTVGAKYGIPVTNKRIAISPASNLLSGHGVSCAVELATVVDQAAKECRVDFVGGFTALVQKGFSEGDRVLLDALPEILSKTDRVCASVNAASRKAGINMDALRMLGEIIPAVAEADKARQGFAAAKLVVFANIPEDNPFMAGAYMGHGNRK